LKASSEKPLAFPPDSPVAASLLNHVPVALLVLDPANWSVSYANERALDFLPESLGRGSVALSLPDLLQPSTAEVLEGVRREGRSRGFDEVMRQLPSRGETFWNLSLIPLGAPGPPQRVLLCAVDVTEQVGLREGLRGAVAREAERTEELSAIVAAFPDGLILTDAQGIVLFANSRAAEVLGLGRPDLDQADACGLLGGKGEGFPCEALRGEEVRDHRVVLDRGGAQVHIAAHASPIRERDGSIVGAALVVVDITGWVQAQRKLEAALAEERRRSAQLRVFSQLMMSVNSETEPGRLLDTVVHGATRLAGALSASFYSVERGRLRLDAHCVSPEAFSRDQAARDRVRSLLGRVMRERETLRSGFGELAVPVLEGNGDLTGVLLLMRRAEGGGFAADDAVFVGNLAAHVSVALQNLRRIEHEREIAEYLQRAMLPEIAGIEGLEVHFSYRSATEATLVGGDFYDLIPLSRGRCALIAGDVCGKGLSAATQTAKARYMFRAYASFDLSPGQWLTLVNENLGVSLARDEFVTAALVVVDAGVGTITYSLAGHPPPLLMEAGQPARFLGGQPGLPLNALEKQRYATHSDNLAPGATLLLYTDGLYEARADTELFGVERLARRAPELLSDSLARSAEALLIEAAEFAGGRLRDDVVVGLCRRAHGA